jgi:HK97 family phage major capsid protein
LTETYIRKLKDGDGNYLWQPSYQIGEAQTLLGQRVALCEDMPDIAASAISVVLADFRECYQIVDRLGVSLIDDPYTTKGQRNLFFRRRVGGGVCQWDGIKYLQQHA